MNRRHDARIGAAAADVAAHALPDLSRSELHRTAFPQIGSDEAGHALLGFSQQTYRGNNLPRGAIPALESIVIEESLLHRIERLALGQPLDCGDLVAVVNNGQREAAIDAPPVGQHGARTTLT